MVSQEKSNHNKFFFSDDQFLKYVVALCILLPLASNLTELFQNKIPISIGNIILLYIHSPLQWLVLGSSLAFAFLLVAFKRHLKKIANERQQEQAIVQKQEQAMVSFAKDLEAGKFENTHQFSNQNLTGLMNSVKTKLILQKENDSRAKWTTEGISKFGEILRSTNNLNTLCDEFVKNIVKYVNLNQGSIFICQNDALKQTTLELSGCYAYNRKKYLERTIKPGEGLVGQCFLENDTIIMKQVPANYLRITSGLGEATPRFVALVPIKANEVTEGVLEVAGFKELPDFEIKFIEKVCEAFASVIHSIKSNEETRTLLEATKRQTEQLQSQEEKIRQNMEAMAATHEQLTRQLEENKEMHERVERRERVMALTTILSETDLHGIITYANDKFCEVSKYDRNELLGKPQNIVRHPDMPKELFALFWKTIKRGEVFKGIVKNRAKDGSDYWVDATIVPVKDHDGHIFKYTGSRYHIEDEELAVKLYNKQAGKFGWPHLKTKEETAHSKQAEETLTYFN